MSSDYYVTEMYRVEQGRRWTKVVSVDHDSVRAFIDLKTGEAYAAKSYNAPNLNAPIHPEMRDVMMAAAGLTFGA